MYRTLRTLGIAGLAAVGTLGMMGTEAKAQGPGESVVYETVSPGSRSVTYGEQTRVKYKRHKTVIRERPVAYVTTTPPVVRETRYVQPAPIIEERVVQPPPVIEQQVVQPPPVIETRVIRSTPVVQTRQYYVPYPR